MEWWLGYRFLPNDVELIETYLKNKLNNEALPSGFENLICDVKLYNHNPQELIGMHPLFGKDEDDERAAFERRRVMEWWLGYRFLPNDVELIETYLKNKLKSEALPSGFENLIFDVKLYDHNPQELIGMHPLFGKDEDDERYFFTPRERKYQGGIWPRRTAGNGYWKVNGNNIPIFNNDGIIIGYKMILDFYERKFDGGVRTEWKMQEYVTKEQEDNCPSSNTSRDIEQLDECVLCKIYKNKKSNRDRRQEVDQESDRDGWMSRR
ncbi:hypothetical protein BUALT_Bualt12G0015200 [Buddleja alternifolia]|uniref:NAC domain-containing protein n=1 Tax=Buddleja alternifolia TaxID=168488 RepID=A0AAV6WWA0_9LAMI|nr:hypothetical protein BUALT_Bualt12G0015200 [Buddleja alternifolia]